MLRGSRPLDQTSLGQVWPPCSLRDLIQYRKVHGGQGRTNDVSPIPRLGFRRGTLNPEALAPAGEVEGHGDVSDIAASDGASAPAGEVEGQATSEEASTPVGEGAAHIEGAKSGGASAPAGEVEGHRVTSEKGAASEGAADKSRKGDEADDEDKDADEGENEGDEACVSFRFLFV